jgi:hypothetical protein
MGGEIIPPTGWFSNAGPGRFWPSIDGFLSLGQTLLGRDWPKSLMGRYRPTPFLGWVQPS